MPKPRKTEKDRCPVCDASLAGRDQRTKTCSARCRREANRIAHLKAGRPDGPYETLDGYLARTPNRRRLNADIRATVAALQEMSDTARRIAAATGAEMDSAIKTFARTQA